MIIPLIVNIVYYSFKFSYIIVSKTISKTITKLIL